MISDLSAARSEIVAQARALRPEMMENVIRCDVGRIDVADNTQLIGRAGLNRLNAPAEFGGLWDGGQWGGLRATMEATVELAAADGSTAQCFGATGVVAPSGVRPSAAAAGDEEARRRRCEECFIGACELSGTMPELLDYFPF